MLTNLLKITGISFLACGYYIHQYNRVSLKNQWLRSLFLKLESHKPQHCQTIFKILIRLGLLQKQQSLKNYIMKSGFDIEGNYIKQLSELGFHGVEIGPTSYNPSLEEDPQFYLGINNVIANILTFRNNNSSNMQIQICLAPNHEVLKFTPYLLKQNMLETLKSYIQVQKNNPINIANTINFDFHRKQHRLEQTNPQVKKMLNQLKEESQNLLLQLNKNRIDPIQINFSQRNIGYLQWSKLLDFIVGRQAL